MGQGVPVGAHGHLRLWERAACVTWAGPECPGERAARVWACLWEWTTRMGQIKETSQTLKRGFWVETLGCK